MKKNYLLSLILVAVMIALFTGCESSNSNTGAGGSNSNGNAITIVSGPASGTQEVVGAAVAEIWNNNIPDIEFSAVPSGGTSVNVDLLDTDQGDVGMITADVAVSASTGTDPFEKEYTDLRAIFATYPNTYQIWVQKDSGIEDFDDLLDKKICFGSPGSGPYQVTLNFMSVFGFTEDDVAENGGDVQYLSWGDAVTALQDGNIDAVCWTTTYPAAKITDAEISREFKLLQINPDKLQEFKEIYGGWEDVVIPAGTYKGQAEDITTVGTPNMFAILADIDEDLVYEMTKSLWENKETLGNTHALLKGLSEETVASGMGIELHPGAQRYYEEMGFPIN